MREGRTTRWKVPLYPFIMEINDALPLTNVLKKCLLKGEPTQSGSSRWAALGLILSMTACTSSTAPDRLPGQPVVVGLSTSQHSGTFDAAGQAFTKELGTHSIRVGYLHGDHDFSVNWAAQNGIGVLFFLGYGKGCDATTASGRQCYANRSAGLAQKYGNKVQYYEVWNEWNGGIGLKDKCAYGSPPCNDGAMYADLLCRTYKAIKAVQPSAIVVGGATAGVDTPFISKMLDAGAGNCMDMVSVHPYVYTPTKFSVPYNSPASVGVDKFIEAITAVDNLIRQKIGRTIPIVVSEDGRSDGNSSSNEQLTADYITELFMRAPTVPFLEGIWWYQLEDVPAPLDAPGYGLLRSNNTKKPSFAAYQAAANK